MENQPQRALPDKAVDLIDEAAGRVRARGHTTVAQADIAEVVSLWTGFPLEQIALAPEI